MLKFIVVAVGTLTLVILITLLGNYSVNATTTDIERYMWVYGDLGKHNIVCQKMVIHPDLAWTGLNDSPMHKMDSYVIAVDESFCQGLTKPNA